MQGKSFLDSLSSLETAESRQSRPVRFRNYIPKSRDLKSFVLPAPTVVGETELSVQREVHEAVQEFLRQQDEPLNVVPKKPNWDLKRNLQRKLDVLTPQTESAFAELLRRSLSQEKAGITSQEQDTNEPENQEEGEKLIKAIDIQSKIDAVETSS